MPGRMAAAILLCLALVAPAAAQPQSAMFSHAVGQGGLLLSPGERVTLRVEPDGRLTVLSITLADPSEIGLPKEMPEAAPLGRSALVRAAPGTIALVYGYLGSDSLLRIENATQRGIDYQAALLREPNRTTDGEFTSVCTIRPGLVGFEVWQGRRVPALLLTRFSPRPTDDGTCTQPPPRPAATPAD